ncbi:uncharacterized protein FIBRA_01612 [Fibroporia radiculosa]|uniref:Uncharacterized protein n=1 Tax=Fibroporia radiculosa TaxID=599839 RepID=J4H1B2_9APHY|nr:uncharacterized protein FIBRA_01612 [Fibroporia radiculosa]CCL99594.1 predicted protein [Fibroporia radiculosa]
MNVNETHRRPVRTQTQIGRGGNPKKLFAGVAVVSAGLGLFWYTQKWDHRKKQEDVRPGAIPTWEYRMNQERTAEGRPADSLTQHVSGVEPVSRPKDVPLPGSNDDTSGSAILTATHGKGSDQTQSSPEHADEPPKTSRTNDSGETYSKHPDYIPKK